MNLRNKLLLSFLIFVAALVALGVWGALRQTTEAAIDSLFEPVLVTDGEGRITRLNRAAESLPVANKGAMSAR